MQGLMSTTSRVFRCNSYYRIYRELCHITKPFIQCIIRSDLQHASPSALRRLPLDPINSAFLPHAVQGVSFAHPVAVKHALNIISELAATKDPYAVAMALGKLVQPGGALQDVLYLHDVLARVALARLCHTISRARAPDERPDIKSKFNNMFYQLFLDPSQGVCFEAILCVLGKFDNAERMEERAAGWYRLTREILKLPESPSVSSMEPNAESIDSNLSKPTKDKSLKTRRPQPLRELVIRRLESSSLSFCRPVLHAAARVVQEMGKGRAAAFSLGVQDIDGGVHVNSYSENCDSIYADYENTVAEGHCKVSSVSNGLGSKEKIVGLLASLMEVVQSTVAWECFYVRAMVVDALIWIQSPQRSFDEVEYIIASELSDPAWPATLFTLHACFKATPDMAVTLLEIVREFATEVPGKIDADVLQLLGKVRSHSIPVSAKLFLTDTCLVGAGHGSIDRVSASDPKSALALQRLVQAAVMFLGENVNCAASEYAWESTTPPGTALTMLEADKLVAAAISRNPTLAGALTRPQGCAFSGAWEQTMMRNTCERRRWLSSHTFCTDAVKNKFPRTLSKYITEGKLPSIPGAMPFHRFEHLFYELEHDKQLRSDGLFMETQADFDAAGGANKLKYITIRDFMWMFIRCPDRKKGEICSHLKALKIVVLKSCQVTPLKHPIVVCFWESPPLQWHKFNISGFFVKGKRAGYGGLLRDSSTSILYHLYDQLPSAKSRDEVFLLGIRSALDAIKGKPEIRKIILEIDHLNIVKVLTFAMHAPLEYMDHYRQIFDRLSNLNIDKHRIVFLRTQGNGTANRLAYLAATMNTHRLHLFLRRDRELNRQIDNDNGKCPRFDIVFKKPFER